MKETIMFKNKNKNTEVSTNNSDMPSIDEAKLIVYSDMKKMMIKLVALHAVALVVMTGVTVLVEILATESKEL